VSAQRQPQLRMGLDDAVDRCWHRVLRTLLQLDITDPLDRACVLAEVHHVLSQALDEQAKLAVELGARGTQAKLARAMRVSPQAISKRFR
jgi:hypothetical protein